MDVMTGQEWVKIMRVIAAEPRFFDLARHHLGDAFGATADRAACRGRGRPAASVRRAGPAAQRPGRPAIGDRRLRQHRSGPRRTRSGSRRSAHWTSPGTGMRMPLRAGRARPARPARRDLLRRAARLRAPGGPWPFHRRAARLPGVSGGGLLDYPVRHDEASELGRPACCGGSWPGCRPPWPRGCAGRWGVMGQGSQAMTTGRLAEQACASGCVRRVAWAGSLPGCLAKDPGSTTRCWPPWSMRCSTRSPAPDGVRLNAAVAIQAILFRGPEAAALGAEVARIATAAHAELSICIMDALRLLGEHAAGPRRTVHAEPPAPPPVMPRPRAISATSAGAEDRYWMRAIDLHSQLDMRHQSPASGATLRGLVYALGLARNDPMLTGYVTVTRYRARPARPRRGGWVTRGGSGRARRCRG